jgi:hypothetical protein
MNKLLKITGITILAIGAVWTFMTVWAERVGPKRSWQLGSPTANKKVLIIYDPDHALETLIRDKKANLLDFHSLWLLKPNDESRMQESNVTVSVSMAYSWGKEIAKRITATAQS